MRESHYKIFLKRLTISMDYGNQGVWLGNSIMWFLKTWNDK